VKTGLSIFLVGVKWSCLRINKPVFSLKRRQFWVPLKIEISLSRISPGGTSNPGVGNFEEGFFCFVFDEERVVG